MSAGKQSCAAGAASPPTCRGTGELSTSAITALSSELEAKVATWRPPWPSNTPNAEKEVRSAGQQQGTASGAACPMHSRASHGTQATLLSPPSGPCFSTRRITLFTCRLTR